MPTAIIADDLPALCAAAEAEGGAVAAQCQGAPLGWVKDYDFTNRYALGASNAAHMPDFFAWISAQTAGVEAIRTDAPSDFGTDWDAWLVSEYGFNLNAPETE